MPNSGICSKGTRKVFIGGFGQTERLHRGAGTERELRREKRTQKGKGTGASPLLRPILII